MRPYGRGQREGLCEGSRDSVAPPLQIPERRFPTALGCAMDTKCLAMIISPRWFTGGNQRCKGAVTDLRFGIGFLLMGRGLQATRSIILKHQRANRVTY